MKTFLMSCALISAFSTPIAAQETASPGSDYLAISEPAFNGNLSAVQEQLGRGIAVDLTDDEMHTPLMWAAFNGHSPVVAYLLENGAKPDAQDVNGRTALMYASSGPFPETVELLLKNGAGVNIQGKSEGFTALMMATAEGQLEVARLLLVYGAATEIIDRDGDTARSFALEKGHSAIIQLLDNPPDKNSSP